MTNLWTGTISQNGEYQNLATISGLTFTSGTNYTIQIENMAYIREGITGTGFLITSAQPFVCAYSDELYIKPLGSYCVVNIAN